MNERAYQPDCRDARHRRIYPGSSPCRRSTLELTMVNLMTAVYKRPTPAEKYSAAGNRKQISASVSPGSVSVDRKFEIT
jgi:hypothetical protein